MMKHYCDCCGNEITAENGCSGGRVHSATTRLGCEVESKRTGAILRVEIITAMDGKWNDGDFCRLCVLDALYQLDPRRKQKPPKRKPIKI